MINSAPVLPLPPEILDAVLSLIEAHADLLSFALASRACASFAIPRHTEYRILRIRQSCPEFWDHLAHRADLSNFITHVHISDQKTQLQPERIPARFKDLKNQERSYELEEIRIENMCKAIRHMRSLRSFVWEFHLPPPYKPTISVQHEDAILNALLRNSHLESFALIGPFGYHAPSYRSDPESQQYPLWRFRNMKSLNLSSDAWVNPAISPHVQRLLSNNPELEHLQIPLEFPDLKNLLFPGLKHLRLLLLTGASAAASERADERCLRFIASHPTIEKLFWFPVGGLNLSPNALPNLKGLKTTPQVVKCLASVGDAPSTPTSVSFASFQLQLLPSIPEYPTEVMEGNTSLPSSEIVQRPIEELYIPYFDASSLVDLHSRFMNPTSLRKLKLGTFSRLDDLCRVGDVFPNITWLSLPDRTSSYPPQHIEPDDVYRMLSHFPRLEVLRGQLVWEAVNRDKDKMHLAIKHLAQILPNLRELDHSKYDERRKAWKRIILQWEFTDKPVSKEGAISGESDGDARTGDDGGGLDDNDEVKIPKLSYAIALPRPRDVWDIFHGEFD